MAADTFSGKETLREIPRVLVVEDDPSVRRVLKVMLGRLGYKVEVANNGAQGLKMFVEGDFSALLVDISMPGINGLELLRRIREEDQDTPIILMTGLPSLDTAIEAVKYNAFRYVPKPIRLEELSVILHEAVTSFYAAQLSAPPEPPSTRPGSRSRAENTAQLEERFEQALGLVWLAFQPLVRANDGSVFGYEVLLRSDHPHMARPAELLRAALRLDRLDEVSHKVHNAAAAVLSRNPDLEAIFINVHPDDLFNAALLSSGRALARFSSRVVLEITEQAASQGSNRRLERIRTLRTEGYHIAVDDLGSAWSGLSSFAAIEPDFIKLDRSLIQDIDVHPLKQRLIQSMVEACRDLGVWVVAEGVETASELRTLRAIGCDLLQGFLLARPQRQFVEPNRKFWSGS